MSSAESKAPGSLCVLRLSAIGDCIHTLPVVRSLRAALPDTDITWVIGRTEHALLEGIEGINFITFDKSKSLRSLLSLRSQLKDRHFDVLLNMQASWRGNLVSKCIPAERRIGFDMDRARDEQHRFTNEQIAPAANVHVMEGLMGFARHLGVEPGEPVWDIPVPAEARQLAEELAGGDGPLVVISPCSSQRSRNYRDWDRVNYAVIARYLQDRFNATVVITGGGTQREAEYASYICANSDAKNLVGETSLKQLYALLGAADLVISPDSGPVHMAVSAGTLVIGLYATSNPGRTGPVASHDLLINRYPEAVREFLNKEPNDVRWGQRVRNPDAMDLISVNDVKDNIRKALADRFPERKIQH